MTLSGVESVRKNSLVTLANCIMIRPVVPLEPVGLTDKLNTKFTNPFAKFPMLFKIFIWRGLLR